MKKLRVKAATFKLCTTIFASLCMIGLLYQNVEISKNYLKYEVVSDIKLVLPEDNPINNFANICFDLQEVMNKSRYHEIIKKYIPKQRPRFNSRKEWGRVRNWKMGDRLDVAIKPEAIVRFPRISALDNVQLFTLQRSICYQVNISFEGLYTELSLMSDTVKGSTAFWISMSQEVPLVDAKRLNEHSSSILTANVSTIVLVDSHNYYVNRLKYPYIDYCYDYEAVGLINRDNAVRNCYFNHTGFVGTGHNILKSDERLLNSVWNVNTVVYRKCEHEFHWKDCRQNTVFTRSVIQLKQLTSVKNRLPVNIDFRESQDPSFKISSKEKIDIVDYVTFMFSTVGTWLGLSVLSFDPFPFCLSAPEEKDPKEDILDQMNGLKTFREFQVEQNTKMKTFKKSSKTQLREIKSALNQIYDKINNQQNL